MASAIEMEEVEPGVFQAKKSREIPNGYWIAGSIALVGAIGYGFYRWSKRSTAGEAASLGGGDAGTSDGGEGLGGGASSEPGSGGDTSTWTNARPLPTAADVPGFDLTKNWGKTPTDLRPLFAMMERVSGIDGAGRIFAVIAKRESGFNPAAQNDSKEERDASRRAYANAKDRNPTLKYGAQAAEFGSGGLFAGLAPYFLWTGVPEVGGKAPLLSSPPEIMFLPRVSAWFGCVYLQRLIDNYRLDDHIDIKVGWASPSLLKSGRGNATYKAVRTRFTSDAAELGVDLDDTSTIPAKLSAKRWPGALKVFSEIVGELPTRR